MSNNNTENAQLSILIEYLADLSSRLSKLEAIISKDSSLSKTIDTNNYSKIPQPRSPSMSEIGEEKIDEKETLSNTEDELKNKIRKATEMILTYAKEVPYIMNK